MSSESSYLDDVIIRGRSRASDVPDVHPEPEQRLERLVPSVSPVRSRHGLSADFVARSLRTRSDLAAGERCAVLLTSLPFQRAIARPLGPRRWRAVTTSHLTGKLPHIREACLEPPIGSPAPDAREPPPRPYRGVAGSSQILLCSEKSAGKGLTPKRMTFSTDVFHAAVEREPTVTDTACQHAEA